MQRIILIYADPPGFSGQRDASRLIVDGMRKRGWHCTAIPTPVFERGSGRAAREGVRYLCALVRTWWRFRTLLIDRRAPVHINLGQTYTALVREALPFVFCSLFRKRCRAILSLHGNLIQAWRPGDTRARGLRLVARFCRLVSVLGEQQRTKLLALGIPAHKLIIVPNSCEIRALSEQQVRSKHAGDALGIRARPLRLLHLSTLIESKGYPLYLEALETLARKDDLWIEAVLCGTIARTAYDRRFRSIEDATAWINGKIDSINRSERVRLDWIRGSKGDSKAALFRESHVFVFPSEYPVETQPLVILEAMASGCGIVSTKVGEIRTMIDGESALLLSTPVSVNSVVAALQELAEAPKTLQSLALATHHIFISRFSREPHLDSWERRFSSLLSYEADG